MRRLESLSNTIFGVAMTLLAYGLPQAAHFDEAPASPCRSFIEQPVVVGDDE